LAVVAAVQLGKGYWELCVRAAREARQALGPEAAGPPPSAPPAEPAAARREQLAAQVATLAARAHHARGEEPPVGPRREEALKVLKELGEALNARAVERFQAAHSRLQAIGGYSDTDRRRAFAAALEADPIGTEDFLFRYLSEGLEATGPHDLWFSSDHEFGACCLRSFPSPAELKWDAEVGDGIQWEQSKGQIWLYYRLKDGPREYAPGGWIEEDVVVQMTAKEMKVSIGGTEIKAISGELLRTIWRKDSWWAIDEEGTLVVTLFKRELTSWPVPILTRHCGVYKREPFPWNERMKHMGSEQSRSLQDVPPPTDLPDESALEAVQPGRPPPEEDEPAPGGGYVRTTPGGAFAPPCGQRVCRAEDLCIGITTEQDNTQLVVQVHFERHAFETLKSRMSLEKIVAVDVWQNWLCIFLQGDKLNPILWGELHGQCMPFLTSWHMASAEGKMRQRQNNFSLYSPVLEVRVRKSLGSQGIWPKPFAQCVQAKLMVQRWYEGKPRFEGLPDVPTARRAGYDLDEPDFWDNVEEYCRETVKKIGHSTAPKAVAA